MTIPTGPPCLLALPTTLGGFAGALPFAAAVAASGREVLPLTTAALAPLAALAVPTAAARPPLTVAGDGLADVDHEQLTAAGAVEAILLAGGWRLAFRLRAAGIAWRWGYAGGLASLLLHPAIPPPRPLPDGPERWAALAAALELPPYDPGPRLAIDAVLRAAGRARLERARVEPGSVVALLPRRLPGSGREPWAFWAELSRTLRRELPALRQVVLVGAPDLWLAVRIFEETGKVHPVIGPDLDLATTAALLAEVRIAVGSGDFTALAAAVGTPTVRVEVAARAEPAAIAAAAARLADR